MSKDSPRLSRLGVLAPAALSACMDASVLAVPAAGAIVSTVLKELSKAFMLKKWYHGVMSAKQAEHLLMNKGKNGSYLVRESQSHSGEYALSVRVSGRVSHVIIKKQNNKYDVGIGEQFDDLVGLIEHFRCFPIIEASGDVLRLQQPVSGAYLRNHKFEETIQKMTLSQSLSQIQVLDGEFYCLKTMTDMHIFTTHEGLKPENYEKNRYNNVLPYDKTRVILRIDEDMDKSDYINANFIRSVCELSDTASATSSSSHGSGSGRSSGRRCDKRSSRNSKSSSSEDVVKEVKRTVKMDKINGNLQRNLMKDKYYIATQGCLANTINDFWRMLWQEDVRIIVMITEEVEKHKTKCVRYWPRSKEEATYDELTVQSVSETRLSNYIVREFDVNDKNTCRTIYQLQYLAWPDHSAPTETRGVLTFLEDINRRMYRITQEKDAPEHAILCVHCSAGIGRTGTFIVLDMLIDKVKQAGDNCEIDVYNTVKTVRAQRSGMVQNKAQYRFIYMALHSYINNNNIKLNKKDEHIDYEESCSEDSDNLETSFRF